MEEEGVHFEGYRAELGDPPLEMYSDDNAGSMLDGVASGGEAGLNGHEVAVHSDLDELGNGHHELDGAEGIGAPALASEAADSELVDEENENGTKTVEHSKVPKKGLTGSQKSCGGSNNGKTLGRTTSTMKKSPTTGSTAVRPFLKSSSPAAIARRQESNGNGVHAAGISSTKSNGSISAPTTPRASATTPKAPTTPKTPALKKRSPADTPVTPTSSRRSSMSPSLTPSRSSVSSADPSRRASLSAVSTRSAPSAAELKKWASSSSSKTSSVKPATPGRLTSLSLHSPGSVSKSAEFSRRKAPSTPTPKSPGAAVKACPKFSSPSPKQQGSLSSSSSSIRPQVANGSPSNSISSLQRKSSPMTLTSKRSPRTFESPTISSRSMSSAEKTPSSDKSHNMLARRKSLTPEPRDTRLIALPPVDVKAGDDVRLDLRGQKLRSLDCNLVNLTPKLEFVYLRDNKLSNLNGIEILKRVKVLDLSFNEFKGGGFEPLANCKALQQLYLAGNQITSLSGLPQLPNLEFLSVAQNRLKSLAMATQPRLQVLAASKNKISTLKGFPHLPALEHLRLEENPILELPHLEAASILLVGPTLKKFNDRDLSADEQEIAQIYPATTALCIRDGWEFCSPEEAAESTTQFLMAQWRDHLPPGFTLTKVIIDRPFEEDPCHCEFLFQQLDDGHDELILHYQWFIGEQTPINFVPIEGATNKVYWPKHEDVGRCLKVDCTPTLGGKEFPPVSAFSFHVSPGTGCPKVLSIQVDGEPIEGNLIRGSAEVAWCGGTPGSGVVSWLRRAENSSPVAILGAEDYEYSLVLEDVGSQLLFMYTPVTEEGVKGESQYAITPIIEAAPPCVTNVRVTGEFVEGNTIHGIGQYFGGKEGASKFEWLREEQDSGDFKLVGKGSSEYLLTEEDVGLRLMFVYTPANTTGRYGPSMSVTTEKILLAPPRVIQLRLVGEMREGSKVVVSGIFIGGVEGASRVQWFKLDSPSSERLEAISTSKIAKAFRIPLGAVGHYLASQYTPVRSDGESGEPAVVISDTQVEMLPPSLNFLSITGEFLEGETLTASYGYVGGYEGSSQYSWYLHEDKNDPGIPMPEAAGNLQYQVTEHAVNKFISFHCIPIRDDGVTGEKIITMSQERISPGSPKLITFQIVGEPIEGAELRIEKLYWGGKEGSSTLQWFLTSPDGAQREIRGAVNPSYIVRTDDVNGLICCSCEPVREDGAKGPICVSQLVGPVIPGPPTCKSLEIGGHPVEGEHLYAEVAYSGGEKGPCELEWWRRSPSGEQRYLGNAESLELTSEDVGAHIKLVFIPVRSDGFVGDAYAVTSDVVEDAEPEGKDLYIPDCLEDVEVVPQKSYFGGQEGNSHYMWYRTTLKLRDSNLPIDAEFLSSSLTYTPKLEDVGAYLILEWVPVRKDGKQGRALIACSRQPVAPAPPSVWNVSLKEVSPDMFVGDAYYHGGREGESQLSWYRESANSTTTLIEGATSKTYVATEDDYTCRIIFGYTPVRDDGAVGDMAVSEPSNVIYPELPRVQKFVLSGKVVEGEVLTALEVMPKGETQQRVWDKFKKEIKYQWSRATEPGGTNNFEPIHQQWSCTYKVRLEDIGYCLRCECVIYDVFGRSADPVSSTTQPVVPAFPRIEKLEIEGRGFHTNLYAVRGIYVGGREGKSTIQWFRAMAGSPDLIPIPGETGRMYEANVDDVGYRLVAVYTPVREDGVEGNPTSASTDPIEVEPEVAKEVKQKLELGAVKFEVLRDRDRSPMNGQPQQTLGSLERRVLDVNRKRVKVVRPGSKTSFPSTEIRGTYAPPFHVELFRNDQHRLKIVIDSENEVDLMVRTRHIRDVIALAIRGLAQRYNSTPLNLLLKM